MYGAGFKILRSVAAVLLMCGQALFCMMLQNISSTTPKDSLADEDPMMEDDDPRSQMSKELICSSVIAEGDDEGVQYYLDHGADPNVKDYKHYDLRPLHKAILTHQNHVVEILLAHQGIDPNGRTKSGETPLHMAAKEGLADVIPLLLQKGADIGARTVNGQTVLHYAVEANRSSVVDLLIKAEACINEEKRNNKKDKEITCLINTRNNPRASSLFYAVQARNYAMVQQLLGYGADIKLTVGLGLTALHVAAQYGDAKMVELLINAGAKVNAQASRRVTPLHCAIECGDLETIEILIKHGAHSSVRDLDGKTPLDYAGNRKDMWEKIQSIFDPLWRFRGGNLLYANGHARFLISLSGP